MKFNRFIALAAIALLVVATMGFLSYQALAQTDTTHAVSDCGPETEDDDAAEAAETGPDTDDIQEECGNQVNDESDDANEPDDEDTGLDVQDPNYTGSISVDEAQYEGMSEADEAAVLQQYTTISAIEAEAAVLGANPGATLVKSGLDNENGILVYSVELDNGVDVKVDAGNGTILFADSADD